MAKLLNEMGVKALFPTIAALAKAGADQDFAEWAEQPENAKALMDWYKSRLGEEIARAEEVRELVHVPDLPTLKFVQLVEYELKLTHLDPLFLKQEFIRDERGATFETRFWTPVSDVIPAKHVRAVFAKDGFSGNTPAFMAWLMRYRKLGSFASIPDDAGLFRSGRLRAASEAFRSLDNRLLSLSKYVRIPWNSGVTFVAFRKVNHL